MNAGGKWNALPVTIGDIYEMTMKKFPEFLIFVSSLAATLGINTYPFVVEEFIAVIIFHFSGQITRNSVLKYAVFISHRVVVWL